MTKLNEYDFVKVDFDLYANESLAQTTDKAKAKEAGLKGNVTGPMTMILGKAFVLKAFDDALLEGKTEGTLELSVEEAYGKRQKELLKTFPKSSFDNQEVKPVRGMTYDFNGMYGTVKSVVGGRVMVDFNNPLSGKDIKIDFKNVEIISDLTDKISYVLEQALRLPKMYFDVSLKDTTITLSVPEQLLQAKEMLVNSLEEMMGKDTLKDFKVELVKKDMPKPKSE